MKVSNRLHRWSRFSLRTFLVFFTLFAVLLGYKTYRANQQREAVESIGQYGYVIYRHEKPYPMGATGRINYKAEPPGPRWIRRLIGNDFFQEVRDVDFFPTDESMSQLAKLREVDDVTIDASNLTDDGVRHLVRMPKLQRLSIVHGHGLTNKAFYHIGKIPRLRYLHVDNIPISSDALEHLKDLHHLEHLELFRTLLKPSDFEILAKTFSAMAIVGRGTYERTTEFYSIQMRIPNGRVISTNDELTKQERLSDP